MFAALVTLALALLDEIPGRSWRIASKVVAFIGLAYLLLVNVSGPRPARATPRDVQGGTRMIAAICARKSTENTDAGGLWRAG